MNHTGTFRNPTVPLTEMQKWLRKRVLRQAVKEPATFNMTSWENDCDTTRCIAGWAQFLVEGTVTPGTECGRAAVDLLGLTAEEYYGAGNALASYRAQYNERDNGLFFTLESEALERLRKLARAK